MYMGKKTTFKGKDRTSIKVANYAKKQLELFKDMSIGWALTKKIYVYI